MGNVLDFQSFLIDVSVSMSFLKSECASVKSFKFIKENKPYKCLLFSNTVALFAIHYKIIQLYVQNTVYHDHAREEVKTVTYFSIRILRTAEKDMVKFVYCMLIKGIT